MTIIKTTKVKKLNKAVIKKLKLANYLNVRPFVKR